jgi:hypothetical protein
MGMLPKQLHWEPVDESWVGRGTPTIPATYRAKVPGGWLLCVSAPFVDGGSGAVFLPDPEHKWPVATRDEKKSR